jgi:hypothetical protein
MKIFVDLKNTNNLQKALEKYFIESKYETFIYSNEGIYKVDISNLYKLTLIDKPIKKIDNYCNILPIFIDETNVVQEQVNQLPPNHILILKNINTYSYDKKSNIRFIIEVDSSIDKVIDYYFDIPDDTQINGKIFQQNFIEFLSLLN